MDQTHTRAIKALEEFVHLAEATAHPTPRFVADLIFRATSAPHTYCFTRLLETPAVQSLNAADVPAEQKAYYKLLQIFAWGTIKDVQNTPDLPPLNDRQSSKLQLLTLLSLASNPSFNADYASLQEALSLPSPRALEDLITTAIYSSLIRARLSPASTPPTVRIDSIAPVRDPPPGSVNSMLKLLEQWQGRCASVVSDIEAEIAMISAASVKRRQFENERSFALDHALKRHGGHKRLDGPSSTVFPANTGGKRSGKMPMRNLLLDGKAGAPSSQGSGHLGFGASMGMGSNKRPSAEEEEESDDASNRMDIDDGVGLPGRDSNERHAKRVLGSNLR